MNANLTALIVLLFIVAGGVAFLHNMDKEQMAQKKLSQKNVLETAINFKKNKRKNSLEYKAILEGDMVTLEKHLESLTKKQEVDSFKNILLSKSKLRDLSKDNKIRFFNLLKGYESKNKYVDLFRVRIFASLFYDVKDEELLKIYKSLVEENDRDKNLVILSELRNRTKNPDFIIDYALNLFDSDDSHMHHSALAFYSQVKNNDNKVKIYKTIKSLENKLSSKNKSFFHTINLTNHKVLQLKVDDFKLFLKEEGLEWQELQLNIIERFALIKQEKSKLVKIARGTNVPWIKKRAKNLLEKL